MMRHHSRGPDARMGEYVHAKMISTGEGGRHLMSSLLRTTVRTLQGPRWHSCCVVFQAAAWDIPWHVLFGTPSVYSTCVRARYKGQPALVWCIHLHRNKGIFFACTFAHERAHTDIHPSLDTYHVHRLLHSSPNWFSEQTCFYQNPITLLSTCNMRAGRIVFEHLEQSLDTEFTTPPDKNWKFWSGLPWVSRNK